MAYADFQSVTLLGRIANLTVITTEDERQCLAVTLYHCISQDATVTIKFLNSNGLLTAYGNGNLVVGQDLTVTGKLQGIRAFYIKDEELTPLKQPEFKMRVTDYAFGSKPQPKAQPEPTSEVASVASRKKAKAEPTLEPVAF